MKTRSLINLKIRGIKIKNMRNLFLIIFAGLLFSCAPPRQFRALQKENASCQEERELLKKNNEKLTVENNELEAKIAGLEKKIQEWGKDSLKRFEELNALKRRYEDLGNRYENLKEAQESILEGSASEARELLGQLQSTQEDLQNREDKLNELSREIDQDKRELEHLRSELESRNARLVELENILQRKEEAVNELKNKVSAALMGFEGEGLTVTQKNGKVYVSLEEKLLFGSGSTEVDAKGVSALKKLAGVLENNRDINIMIEGHTDDVPVIPGSRFKDNWGLSVQRATAIVRILLDGTTINPRRLTAAGRSEFMPVDTGKTAEARQKNRRTEIILTPNLDELFRILETN